ncbi:MAG: riboflavin synthase [Actinobacteria bacterium]|nr:riboflavin synthase [Actinomycetota bacterium]
MFTGIVEELGRYLGREGDRFRFSGSVVLEGSRLGDSIAVNGCCLTLVQSDDDGGWWEADLSPETLARTSLGTLQPGDVVNEERPLTLDARLGGHLVLGHVDAVGTLEVGPPDLRIGVPADLLRYCVPKGSVAIDGVSLTIVDVVEANGGTHGALTFAIIPHTAAVTTLGHKAPGSPVNLEVDVMAKHVEKLVTPYLARP